MSERFDCIISYAREDISHAQKLFLDLKRAGIHAWMDKPPRPYQAEGLKPGEIWETRIREVISTSDHFIPCFSKVSVSKVGYVQSEFRQALTRLAQLPHGEIFVLPIRLDECEVPRARIDGVSFDQYHYIDCFTDDFAELIHFLKGRVENSRPDQQPGYARQVEASSVTNFFSAIESNTDVILDGSYDLTNPAVSQRRHIGVEEVYDGFQAFLTDLNDLRIRGRAAGKATVSVKPRYSTVLELRRCESIVLEYLSLGHTDPKGTCRGSVIRLIDCRDVSIRGCDLFGSGAYAFEVSGCDRITFLSTSMRECTYGVAVIEDSQAVLVEGCEVRENSGFYGFDLKKSSLRIARTEFISNQWGEAPYEYGWGDVFRCSNATVELDGVQFDGNIFRSIGDISDDSNYRLTPQNRVGTE